MTEHTGPATTMLVVGDEQNIRDLLAQTLPLVGFDVVAATTGFEALTVAERVRPGLIAPPAEVGSW